MTEFLAGLSPQDQFLVAFFLGGSFVLFLSMLADMIFGGDDEEGL